MLPSSNTYEPYLKGFYYHSLQQVKKDKDIDIQTYTISEVAKLTDLSVSSVLSYSRYSEGREFLRVSQEEISLESVEDFLKNKHISYVENQYRTYRNNVIYFGYLPRNFADFKQGNLLTDMPIPQGYVFYKDAIDIIYSNENAMYQYRLKKQIKVYSEEFPELLEKEDLIKFANKDNDENLKHCSSCNKNLNYLRYRVYNREICDICVNKEKRHKQKRIAKLVQKSRDKISKKHSTIVDIFSDDAYVTIPKN